MNTASKTMRLALVALAMFGVASANAAISVNWQGRYEADVMPASASPAWFSDGTYATDISVSGGILSQNTTLGNFAFFRMDPPNYDGSTASGSTIEIRARALSLASGATQSTRMTFGTAARFWELFLNPTTVKINSQTHALDATQFHIYRVQFSDTSAVATLSIGT